MTASSRCSWKATAPTAASWSAATPRYLTGRATAIAPLPDGASADAVGLVKALSEEELQRRTETLRALGYLDDH